MTSFANGIRFYVNPKAKYLSNAVENVLYNIGKSDRSSLAWQTCRTNQRSLNNRRLSAQHDMVPLTRRVSSILKVPGWKRDEVDKAERRKNIFYQMLKASQDIADDNKISPILRPNCVTRQNGGMVAQNMKVKDDRIFNEIYDKLKDQDENIFRPYPEVPVYKVHHKKKIITKRPQFNLVKLSRVDGHILVPKLNQLWDYNKAVLQYPESLIPLSSYLN
ncbi:uncharacterized protein Dwil_GK28012 [Drosophila willistoni]|uniref:Uncharacterized protein n=1 Tax=Drosophila willistoni TaxID=7260 RepID=A0A0Q9WPJ9_DROWI|nr:uncharacterized protein Dwil_GK28012 [Drosophila willistoni]